ncbi:hypothetical protein F3Y22_tig00110893pilonHSYRG01001 [Hibiscus syriacus]|uniref:Uncharacterized protein n=1 Tax=Hibiscus syriacus TaxID=106335 RepID=A0A6A2ZI75_HIBSY|nr:hypothetical protein F3Y22_tig00110893pilonHSYRG01001 [Hibiscus syriacus]
MDHTFLGPQRGILLTGKQLKDLALTWSFVADNAIWSLRYDSECGDQGLVQLLFIRISHPTDLTRHDLFHGENGNQTKAISYINAFSESWLPCQLIKWVTSQTGIRDKARSLNVTSPVALLSELPAISMLLSFIFSCRDFSTCFNGWSS